MSEDHGHGSSSSSHGSKKSGHGHDHHHGATVVRASKGGGAGKWIIGAAAAAVLLGGGYYAWSTYAPNQSSDIETAYNDSYDSDPLRAVPLDPSDDVTAETASEESAVAAPACVDTPAPRAARRSTPARANTVPEETIGITPISATTGGTDSDEIVVTAPRRPTWSRAPTARRLSAMYPERALERGREGEARLACVVQDGGALDCQRVEETPGGFGAAAMRIARTYRHSPTLADGTDATGSPVNLRVVFRIEEEERRQRYASR